MQSSTNNFENNILVQAHPKASYKNVIQDRSVFMETLQDLLKATGTKFTVPEIGGKTIDLHRLFIEVSSRGGLNKVIRDRRWREVTSLFTFPPTTPSASFYLRSNYIIFLLTYEQFYLFRGKHAELPLNDTKVDIVSKASLPALPNLHSRAVSYNMTGTRVDTISKASIPSVPNLHNRSVSYNIPDAKVDSVSEASIPTVPNLHSGALSYHISETKVDSVSEASIPAAPNSHNRAVNYNMSDAKADSVPEVSIPAVPNLPSRAVSDSLSGQHSLRVGDKVKGKMNGKFENGYTITATVGSEVMHGVLYLVPMGQQTQPLDSCGNSRKRSRNETDNSEPKPNVNGYNLFFNELYSKVTPVYSGQEEVIIRHIKSLWDKLSESEKKVYQDRVEEQHQTGPNEF